MGRPSTTDRQGTHGMQSRTPHSFSRLAEEVIADFRGIPLDTPKRMKRRETKALAPMLEELLVKYHIGSRSPVDEIRDHWASFVGTANQSYSHPVEIDKRGHLVVLVSHAIVRNELFMHRTAILEKVKSLPGCGQVRDLRFRAG